MAKERNAALWSDDAVIRFVGQTDFGVAHIWTQLALNCFVKSGPVSVEDFNLVTAKLAACKYATIVWNAETIIAAGVEANWDPDAWSFRQCLTLIEKADVHVSEKARIVATFLRLLRRSNCIELKQSAVIQAMLSSLGDARGVRWLLQRLDAIFGVDVVSAAFMRPELEFWLQSQ